MKILVCPELLSLLNSLKLTMVDIAENNGERQGHCPISIATSHIGSNVLAVAVKVVFTQEAPCFIPSMCRAYLYV